MRTDRIVCTSEQAKVIDLLTQTTGGIRSDQLIEAAGVATALLIRQHHVVGTPVLVLAGPGNNGGDGCVIARILSRSGYPVTLLQSGEAGEWPKSGIIVDALFGIGLTRDLDAATTEWVRRVNESGCTVWSVDIPSGLDATNGLVRGAAVRAHHTVALGGYKTGYFSGVGTEHCGRIHLVPLGFPFEQLEGPRVEVFFETDAISTVKPNGAHKYENGVVHVLGGSTGMSGAVVMAANAAWKAGCGAVTVHVPLGLLPRVDANLIQQVKFGHGSPTDTHFSEDHLASVLDRIAKKPGCVLIGPGMGTAPETLAFVRKICTSIDSPIVIDADALSAIGGVEFANAILTPHPGELGKLTGKDVDTWESRIEASRSLSMSSRAIVVSKGQPTAVVSPCGDAQITGYDTKRFSRMGFGDVLSGTIAAFRSFQNDPVIAVKDALLTGCLQSLTTDDPFPLP